MSLSVEQTLQKLRICQQEGRVAHAYAFFGDVEVNYAQLIEPWLRELLPPGPWPHPDLYCIRPTSRSRRIVIDAIRPLIAALNQTSYAGGWKAVVIFEPDRMTEEASNALLKTLEEPTPRTVFILLTRRAEQLLPTIISRCLKLRIQHPEEPPDPQITTLAARLRQALDGPSDLANALALSLQLQAILSHEKELIEQTASDQLDKASDEGFEASEIDEIEKEIKGQSASAIISKRSIILRELLISLGRPTPDQTKTFEEARFALHRNVQEPFVFDRLFTRLLSLKQKGSVKDS